MDLKDISGAPPAPSDLGVAIAEGRDAIRAGLMETLPQAGRVDLERLGWIAKADRAELWRSEGARDCAEWLSAVFHISNWKARRWIGAARALERLPYISAALGNGSLSLDKVVELARFATPDEERALVTWARKVKMSSIRKRADAEMRRNALEAEKAQDSCYLRGERWDDNFKIETMVPLDEGSALMEAVDRLAHELPDDPDGGDPSASTTSIERRRARALVLLVTGATADSKKESTLVLYAPMEALAGDGGGCSIGLFGFHPETARRLSCDCHLNIVLEGTDGDALGIGNSSRVIPRRIRRHVLRRDGHTCTFPGTGPPIFYRPDGRIYEPGRMPPQEAAPDVAETPNYAEAAGYSRIFDLTAPRTSIRKRTWRTSLARHNEERLPSWAREHAHVT